MKSIGTNHLDSQGFGLMWFLGNLWLAIIKFSIDYLYMSAFQIV